jgi:hypothetical protein
MAVLAMADEFHPTRPDLEIFVINALISKRKMKTAHAECIRTVM